MEDRYLVLLQKVVEENSRLRETIEARDAQQQRLFEELSSKLEGTHSGQAKHPRKRARTIPVPQQCRQDFRKIYKVMTKSASDTESFQGFMMGESFSTEANQCATNKVIEAVVADHGGTNKCPWSAAELRGAAATYFKSLNDAVMRAKRGKKEDHKKLCRKQGRMRDKIQRRLSSLMALPWSEEKKTLLEPVVGSIEYTSSDESDFSEDENEGMQLSGYLVKRLPWERSSLAKVKKALDEDYRRRLTPRAKVNFLPRREHTESSTRQRPINRHDWAVRPETCRTELTPSIGTQPSPSVSTPSIVTVSPHHASSAGTLAPATVRPHHTRSRPYSSSSTQPPVASITTPSPRTRSPAQMPSSTLTPRTTSTTRGAPKKGKKLKQASCRRPLQTVSEY